MNKMGHYATVYVVLYGMIAPMVQMTQECKSSINRHDSVENKVTICCKVSCKPGFFVDICKVNGTADKCEPCPEGTYLDDTTNSDLPVKCRTYDCPPESVPASTFPPRPACQKKCICDVRQKYVGTDPCACTKARVNCTDGTSLTISNTCEATGKEPTTTTYQPIHTTAKQNPEYTISTEGTTVTPNFTTPAANPDEVENKGLWIILIVIVLLCSVVFVPIGVICYCKRRKETIKKGGENGGAEQIPLNGTQCGAGTEQIPLNGTQCDAGTEQIPLNGTRYEDENHASQFVRNESVNSRRNTGIFANGNSQLDKYCKIRKDEGTENIPLTSIPPDTYPMRSENNASQIMGNGSVGNNKNTGMDTDANEDADGTNEERKDISSMHFEHEELHAMKNGSMNSKGTNVIYRSPKRDIHGNGTFSSDKTDNCSSALPSAPTLSPSSMDDDPVLSYGLKYAPALESLLNDPSHDRMVTG